MRIQPSQITPLPPSGQLAQPGQPLHASGTPLGHYPSDLRQVFDQFVGQTFFQQMLGALRQTVNEPAYFHGGRAEEIFQGQLDQVLSERMTEATAAEFTGPMFELFTLSRR